MILLCCGCSGKKDDYTADIYSQEKQQLIDELNFSAKSDNSSNNLSSSANFSCDITLPEGFTKIEKGTEIYMYNNAGSSIIISEIGAVNSFYDLDKTDAYQLIGSNYAQIVVDEFYRQTILGCDAVVIEFSYENSGETYYSVYYLIKYEDFCINAVIQSPKHDLCDKLNDIFGDAVIKFN